MKPNEPHRTLVVAHRTAAAPLLLEEIARRRAERATVFVLLIPLGVAGKRPDWPRRTQVRCWNARHMGPWRASRPKATRSRRSSVPLTRATSMM